ncbi:hypothetical protein FNF27_03181 [Cafeteria roenbergensis]|uniref:Uncharacterized protein n=1 Tax=Cafeteria roenbergensis TaxID=33653 RepID=A0A5A8E1A2_CAFRO|nr:hypothetical protein FNF29_06823 [Cafeteria roenbergensis]KAA0162320.1 hypothetical protein FNF31_03362 [Cafeteria roenbergensis]KAA0169721.1 hypothetical protein FNF28_01840 [Cafeteria roenbergensis]KAA0175481.1 hypothetical protein FNF27_03181 [Cafeteria roenbergensis]|eukprot:KAA0148164.1 hypothetical protein FNF29_06823 [Cafeteria roenbergensis]
MPKRKPRTQKVACPDTYVDALEGIFDEAIAAALEGKGVPAKHRDAVRVMLIQMKTSTMDAIWEHVDPIDDPAADAVPQPLDRALIARIAEAEQRLAAASDRVKRLRASVPSALKEAAEKASSAAEGALTGPVEAGAAAAAAAGGAEAEDEDEGGAAEAAAAASRRAATAALDAGQLLRAAAAAVHKASGQVEGVAGAVAMEASLGVTGADRALEGKGARSSARRR